MKTKWEKSGVLSNCDIAKVSLRSLLYLFFFFEQYRKIDPLRQSGAQKVNFMWFPPYIQLLLFSPTFYWCLVHFIILYTVLKSSNPPPKIDQTCFCVFHFLNIFLHFNFPIYISIPLLFSPPSVWHRKIKVIKTTSGV